MVPSNDRVVALEGRCSPFAAELLRELKNDPHFVDLVAALENIEGQIYRSDIEAVFALIRTTSRDPHEVVSPLLKNQSA